MLITTHKNFGEGLIAAKFDGDKLVARHVQNVTPIMEACYKERIANMGSNLPVLGDVWEKIASVPHIVFAEHPEFLHDGKALLKWLREDEEGRMYRTSTRNI